MVAQPEPYRVVDGDVSELGRIDEPHLGRLVANQNRPANDPTEVGDGELLAHLAVRVPDHVSRVGVDAEQPGTILFALGAAGSR